MRFLPSFLLTMLLAPTVIAQGTGTLGGRVLDAETRQPLPGAIVTVQGTQLGVETDIEGNYRIIGVPVGLYTIAASFVGFETETVDDVEITSGYMREISFEMGEAWGSCSHCYPRRPCDSVGWAGLPLFSCDAFYARRLSGFEIQRLPGER